MLEVVVLLIAHLIKCNSVQWWNNGKCQFDCKKRHVCEKYYIWNPATCSCENEKYLTSIIDDSVNTWDAIRVIWRRNKNYSDKF